MRIVFSEHVVERMKERKISELQVYTTIKSPQITTKSYRDRILFVRKFGNESLEVVAKMEDKNMIIISTYMIK